MATEESQKAEGLNRREFLELMGTGLGILAVSSLVGGVPKAEAAPAKVPQKWDREADVVVIGFGGAGAAAAIAAHDAGAKVVVLEKMPESLKGGTTKVSGNMCLSFTDQEGAKKYFHACAQGKDADIPEKMVDAWAQSMMSYPAWLESLGAKVGPSLAFQPEFKGFPGAESVRTYTIGAPGTRGTIFLTLADAAEKRKIPVLYETAAHQLVWDGQVRGVIAEKAGRQMSIKARKAVILTCGGFEYNPDMQRNYLGHEIYGVGNPGNTGDGITMGLSVGADLWHMTSVAGPYMAVHIPALNNQYSKSSVSLQSLGMKPNFIWVNKFGRRFVNEFVDNPHGKGIHDAMFAYDIEAKDYPCLPSWLIFDETARKAGPVVMLSGKNKFGWQCWAGVYEWSKDNQEEINKGWILSGQTIQELAANMAKDPETKIDPGVLKETFDTYTAAVAAGKDAQFNRPAGKLVPLQAPYYAIKVVPGMLNTQGGPRRNHQAQVVDPQGQPIPHLYSAGELGAIYPWLYNGGGNVGEAVCIGRLAGQNAAREK